MPQYSESTVPNVSNDGKAAKLLQQLVWQGMPQNRPEVVGQPIAPDTNVVSLVDTFSNAQMLIISGEDTVSGMSVSGMDLWAKIASITGGTFPERAYLEYAIKNPSIQTAVAAQIIFGIISSEDLVITLNGGHGLDNLWFFTLPGSYYVNP